MAVNGLSEVGRDGRGVMIDSNPRPGQPNHSVPSIVYLKPFQIAYSVKLGQVRLIGLVSFNPVQMPHKQLLWIIIDDPSSVLSSVQLDSFGHLFGYLLDYDAVFLQGG